MVLAIEDGELRLRVREVLARFWRVAEFADPRQALQFCFQTDAMALVVASLRLRQLDALSFLRQLRREAVTAQTPVIVIGSAPSTTSMTTVLAGGASDFLFEPFTDLELIARVRGRLAQHVALGRARARDRRAASASASAVLLEEALAPADADAEAAKDPHAAAALAKLVGRGDALVLLGTLLAAAPIGFALLGPELRFLRVNERFAELVGASDPASIVGRRFVDALPPSLCAAFSQPLRRILAEGARTPIGGFDCTFRPAQGESERTCVASFYPVRPAKRLVGIGVLLQDVTERRAAEAELRTSRDRIARMIATRDAVLSGVSHELRTPIAAIELWLQVLTRRGDEADTRDSAIAAISANTATLSRVLEDLVDLSRAEGGKLSVHVERVAIRQLVQRVLDEFEPVAEETGVVVSLRGARRTPHVLADPQRTSQVLRNLLRNAFDHAQPNEIQVHVRTTEDIVSITVADDGRGIEAEHLPHLFEPFYQARPHDGQRSRRAPGMGLGLAIARRLLELQRGTLRVHSEPGQGAEFTMTLPRASRETAA